jgi:sulfoxide reductase heme-binding subunit YedZ
MILWDIARASAFVAFGCYTFVLAWGIGLSARSWKPPAAALSFHRFLASLGLVAIGIHITTLMLDKWAKVTVSSLVGLDPRPGVVVGAAALWLAIALPLSFRLKQARWMSQRAWRSLHYFGYAMWGSALVHGVMSGTDSRSAWGLGMYACSAAVVAGAAWYRWMERPVAPPRRAPAKAPARRPQPIPAEAADGSRLGAHDDTGRALPAAGRPCPAGTTDHELDRPRRPQRATARVPEPALRHRPTDRRRRPDLDARDRAAR